MTAANPTLISNLCALVIEAMLYGSSLVLFACTLDHLCRKHPVNWAMVAVSSTFIAISTAYVSVDIHRMFSTSIDQRLWIDDSILFTLYCLQTLIGDAMIIYRCFVAWQSYWPILVPVALWLADVIIWLMTFITKPSKYESINFFKSKAVFAVAFYSFTLAGNLVSTALLAFRIWKIGRSASVNRAEAMERRVYPIMTVAVDSGVLYSAMLIAGITLLLRIAPDAFRTNAMLVPTISLIFLMLILRISIASSHTETSFEEASDVPIDLTQTQESGSGLFSLADRTEGDNDEPNEPYLSRV